MSSEQVYDQERVRQAWKNRVDRFLRDPRSEICLIILIFLSVVLLVAEEATPPRDPSHLIAVIFGDILTGLFAVELLLRFWVAERKSRFFRHYWVDILAVVPLFRAFRILRVLRLVRLFRAGVLLHRRLQSLGSSLAAGFGLQVGLFMAIGIVVLIGALAIHHLEGQVAGNRSFQSLDESFWWSLFTLIAGEPVGGEAKSWYGRLVQAFVVLGGITMFAVFTGVVSAVMVQRLKMGLEVRELELADLKDHIIICGWNRAAPLVIEELQSDPQLRERYMVVVAEFQEIPEQEIRHVADRAKVYFHKGDYTNLDVQEDVGVKRAYQAILLADDTLPRSDQDRDARTVLAALTIEKMNPDIHTCAQLLDRKNNVQLSVAGVEDVVIDDEVSGTLIATSVRNRGITGVFNELLSVQVGHQMYKVPLPGAWANLSFAEVSRRVKEQADALLIAVERKGPNGRESKLNPPSTTLLVESDELVVIAAKQPELEG